MKKFVSVITLFAILVSCLSVGAAAAAADGIATFDALQNAVSAYSDTSVAIKLTANISGTETLSVTKDVYLDLNGFDITCPVSVTGGTLYCMDSQTDDFTTKNGNGFGTITDAAGIAGVPEDAACAKDGYMMIKEGASLSFHRVNLEINSMVLRASEAGVYYRSDFAGDEMVAAQVASYGIALSVRAVPDKDNLETLCEYSQFTTFEPGINNNSTSTLLKNVMKPTNAQLLNHTNSKMNIFGRAYLLTKNGDYLFGKSVSRSFQQQVQAAAADDFWPTLEENQKDSIVSMYRQYAQILRNWNVNTVESALTLDKKDPLNTTESDSLKVLAITSSFGLNTTQLLYDVAVAEGYDPEKVTVGRLYASGCTLEKHLNHAPDKGLYQYSKVTGDPSKTSTPGVMQTLIKEGNSETGEPGATLLDGLLDEDWDIIFMQQGAAQAPQLDTYIDKNGNNRIDQLRAIVDQYKTNPNARFVWNMLWGYQSDSTISPFPTLFRGDQMYMYQCNIDAVMKYVVPRTDYDRIIPTGTVIQNARTSEFGDNLCRDTYHLNNYGGIMAAYGLFAVITGQEITEVNIDAVAVSAKNGIGGAAKITTPLTATQKAIIMESVNNALKDPFNVTESQYPPVEQSYTANLNFIGDSNIAVCPACKTEASWIEINQDNVQSYDVANGSGYFGSTLPLGNYHFYLSSDIEYTATTANKGNSLLHMSSSNRNVCLHLNGNDLTATNCAIATVAGNAKLNIMGTGTVSGNHSNSSKFRGSAIILNAGTTTNPGTVRLYSGTFVQPTGNTQLAPVSTSFQSGLLEIYEDVTITGNEGTYSVCLNTVNNNGGNAYVETVNIYGGTFNRPLHAEAYSSTLANTTLNIYGGTFNDGIEIVSNADVTLSGAPVVSGAGLKLAEGLTVTLKELTTGASIAVDATDAFTVQNSQAAGYLKYFSPVRSGYSITESNGVLSCSAN